MSTLSIDIETYSDVDLGKAGVYKYVESETFEILLFAYSYNGSPVKVIDLIKGEQLPTWIVEALEDPQVIKKAYNAAFERVCLGKHLKKQLDPSQWRCTMVKASMVGLPLGLDKVAIVLRLTEQKSKDGYALIRFFCIPCKPTKTNGGRTRNLPQHSPEKWEKFKGYCGQDVVVELAIDKKIEFFVIPQSEIDLYTLDQQINDRGVKVDIQLMQNAIRFDRETGIELKAKASEITQLENANSLTQLKEWIWAETGEEVTSLNKKALPLLMAKTDSDVVKELLKIRQEMSKTSVKKYAAMAKSVCLDSRIRGLLQFYAARTGRWAGRMVQVQNLRKNSMKHLDLARQILREGNLELFAIIFGDVPDTLSQLIRTAFIPSRGNSLRSSDFSAIEARVIAWLSGEQWRIDVFNTHGKIYEASAAQMFRVPFDSITKTSPLRDKGKVAELALGYQGGTNALKKMGALDMGIKENELGDIVSAWRYANKKITRYWETVGDAAIEAVESGSSVTISHGIRFFVEKGIMFIELPSKRRIAYLRPKLVDGKFGGNALTYEGVDQNTKKWTRIDTYGGKLVENIVQGVARDVLGDAMLRLHKAKYDIVMHVHDEVIMDMPTGTGSAEEIDRIMGETIPWAKGLPLKAESSEGFYYKKD